MDTVNLQAINSATFVFSRLLTPWAALYPLGSGIFRAYMRATITDPVVQYAWSSDGSTRGQITFAPSTANGNIGYTQNPAAGDTLTLGSSLVTFVGSGVPVSASLGSPGLINWITHGLSAGMPVAFTSTGTLPTGIVSGTTYYVIAAGLTLNTFAIAAIPGGTPIALGGAPTGQLTIIAGNSVLIGPTLTATLNNLITFLNASLDPQITLCSYQLLGLTLSITYDTTSLNGNNFALAANTIGTTVSGMTLYGAGGVVTLTAPITDLVQFIGFYTYDLRWEYAGAIIYLFGGTIEFTEADTR